MGKAHSPDVFIIGNLVSTEAEMSNSKAGIEDTTQLKQSMAEKMKAFNQAWDKAKHVVAYIPKVGQLISDLVGAYLGVLSKRDNPIPVNTDVKPKPIDAMTFIKDFDPSDQLVLKLAPGERMTEKKEVSTHTISTYEYAHRNKLVNGDMAGKGTTIVFHKNAGETYDRVFLQGYEGELIKLYQKEDSTGTTVVLGGSAYSSVDKSQIIPVM